MNLQETIIQLKELKLEKAKRPQGENIKAQMSKLGDTIYEAYQVELLKGMGGVLVIVPEVLVEGRREAGTNRLVGASAVFQPRGIVAVSYTHLDVYKRQPQ